MNIKGAAKTQEVKLETPKPAVKAETKPAAPQSDAGKDSKIGMAAMEGNRMKAKLENKAKEPNADMRQAFARIADEKPLVNGQPVRQNFLLAQEGGGVQAAQENETPPVDPAAKADEIIKNNGGKIENGKATGLNEKEANAAGREIAEIAKDDPALAAATMAELQKRLAGTEYGDNAASGFVNNLDDAQLKEVAKAKDGAAVLRNLQERLTTGKVHPNERSEASRLQRALGSLFSDKFQGIDPFSDQALSASPSDATNPDATPEEAAAALKAHQLVADDTSADLQAFTTQLEAHKDDPEWLASYYAAIGSDKTAELLASATSPSGYSNYLYNSLGQGSEDAAEQFQKNTEIIRNSLDTLEKNGLMSQSDMDNLVKSLQKDGFDPNVAIEIFGKSGNDNLQEKFVNSALSEPNKKLDAVASHVLAKLPAGDQARILEGLGNSRLDSFIKNSMAGQAQVMDMENYLRTGMSNKYKPLSGIDGILSAATDQYISGGRPIISPFSQDLKNRLFNSVTTQLGDPKIADKFSENVAFKRALGDLYIQNSESITKGYIQPSGEDYSSNGLKSLNNFYREVLFTPPLANNAASIAKSVVEKTGKVLEDANNLSDAEFMREYGRNKKEMSAIMGIQTAVMVDALEDGLKNIKGKSEAEAQQLIGVLDSLITIGQVNPLAAGIGEILRHSLGDLGDHIANNREKEAIEQLTEGGVDINFDNFAINDIIGQITNDIAHDSFGNTFTKIKEILS